MGKFINIGNTSFAIDRNSDYVDKSGLISVINRTLNTTRLFSCVTRSRRFGKSMAAHMLNAYYDESCDSRSLFDGLEISKDPSFLEHLNRYPVIYIDIADFTTNFSCDDDIVSAIKISLKKDIASYYRDVDFEGDDVLVDVLVKVCECIGKKFIIIIDEWDSILREYGENRTLVDNYIRLLRSLFKSEKSYRVFAGAYLTGILPIKKYKTESALNNFEEYSMVDPADMACYFGFTCEDVEKLAQKYNADKEELRLWYDGYKIGGVTSLYNPYSVIKAVQRQRCMSYWSASGSYDSVKSYIQMNFDGLKDDIVKMLSGENCKVNPSKFQNDMSIINSKDDVFTVLIHLGYLGYDRDTSTCYIPNRELFEVLSNAIGETSWKRLSDALTASEHLLYATLNRDENAVALGVDLAHDENTSILSYNDENSLSCVLAIAYYYARKDYVIHREFASGKGFADLVMIPRTTACSPAIVVELKIDSAVDTAIDQILRKEYPRKVAEYSGDILLVGIAYDRQNKHHSCRIEKYSAE